MNIHLLVSAQKCLHFTDCLCQTNAVILEDFANYKFTIEVNSLNKITVDFILYRFKALNITA